MAGFGGLIRDTKVFSKVFMAFYGAAAHLSVLFVEIMVVLNGLELCWANGFRNISCFSDSLQAVTLIKEGVSPHHRFTNEIQKTRQVINRDGNVEIKHTLG
jgi:ribonuclease HI